MIGRVLCRLGRHRFVGDIGGTQRCVRRGCSERGYVKLRRRRLA